MTEIMHVKVKSPIGVETVPIEKSLKVKDLKKKISEGSSKVKFLRQKGKGLADSDQLEKALAADEIVEAHDGIVLYIRFPDRVQLDIIVDPHESVPQLKRLIAKEKHTSPELLVLRYKGYPLEDCFTLSDYQIADCTMLSVHRIAPPPSSIIINISMPTTSFALVVQLSDSVEDVKNKIVATLVDFDLKGNQRIGLVFGDKWLGNNWDTLAKIGVENSAELFALIRFRGG